MDRFPKGSKIVFGHGGSATVLALTKKYVYKYFPLLTSIRSNTPELTEMRKNIFKYEIYIMKQLTASFPKLPFIIKFYDSAEIKKYPRFMFEKCDYIKFLETNEDDDGVCNLVYKNYPKIIKPLFYTIKMERADKPLIDFLEIRFKKSPASIVKILDVIIFQTIYTLETIYKKYPLFSHNDLFIRNVMVSKMPKYTYKLNGDIYNIPYIGYGIKIIDFGMGALDKKSYMKYRKHASPDISADLWNFLSSIFIYDSITGTSLDKITNNKQKQEIGIYSHNFINLAYINKLHDNKKLKGLMKNWDATLDMKLKNRLIKNNEKILEYFKKKYG